jgi:hypothetical protein
MSGCGAVPVVGEALDDDRDLVGCVAFVDHGFVLDLFVEQTGTLLDGTLDGVA